MDGLKVGLASLGVVAGGVAGGFAVAKSGPGAGQSRGAASAEVLGGGAGATVVGLGIGKATFVRGEHTAGNRFGIALAGLGLGALIGGGIGELSASVPVNPPSGGGTPPSNGGTTAPPTGDGTTAPPTNPGGTTGGSASSNAAELAAGAAQAHVTLDAATTALGQVQADPIAGKLDGKNAVELTNTGLAAGYTGTQAAAAYDQVLTPKTTAGAAAAAPLDDTGKAQLAESAIRANVNGEDAANMFGDVFAGNGGHLTGSEAKLAGQLTGAELEANPTKDIAAAAKQADDTLSQVATAAPTSKLDHAAQVELASGALKGGTTGTAVAADYGEFAVTGTGSGSDTIGTYIGSEDGDMSQDDAARVVSAGAGNGQDGSYSGSVLLHTTTNDQFYGAISGYNQVAELTVGALQGTQPAGPAGKNVGGDAATAWSKVAAAAPKLSLGAQISLTSAALAGRTDPTATGDTIGTAAAKAYGNASGSGADRVLAATGALNGYDTRDTSIIQRYAASPS